MPFADGPLTSPAAASETDRPGPLASWRVLVTRPIEQSAPFAEALAVVGATPVIYPTITLGPPPSWQRADAALAHLADFAWLVFTSPSAVAFTLGRARALGLPAGAFNRVRVAAVGTETARALSAQGVQGVLVPAADQQRQEGLLEALLAVLPSPGGGGAPGPPRILFPQAIGGRELLRDALVAQGYPVEVVPVSETVARDLFDPSDPPSGPPPPFDVATFASPSALRAFVAQLGRDRLLQAAVAVIGPTTADAATALGVRVDVMPPTPSVAALVQAIVDLHSRRFAPPRG